MSAGETVTVVTPILGRIKCAPGYAKSDLYVTIAPSVEDPSIEQPYAKKAQPDDQHFCMVRTPSMGNSFLLVKYPTLDKVMVCLSCHSSVSPEAFMVSIEPVGKPGEHLDNGGKLPRILVSSINFD